MTWTHTHMPIPIRNVLLLSAFSVAASGFISIGMACQAQEAAAVADGPTHLTAPKLFPEKTLAYIRIDDVSQLKEDLKRSSVGKIGQDEELKPIFMEFYGSLVRTTEQMQEAIGLNLDELLSIPSGEMAIALLPNNRGTANVDRENAEDGGERVTVRVEGPAVAIVLDAGKEITSVQVLLQRMEAAGADRMEHLEKSIDRLTLHRYSNPQRAREQFAYFIDDGILVGCSDADYVEELAQVWLGQGSSDRKTLADSRRFTSIMSRCVGTDGERPQVSFYADPLAMVRQFVPRNAGSTMVLAMLPALGLDGFEAVGGSWIVAPPDFDSISHFHILLSSPRRAILGLLRPKSGSTTPEDWIPDTVASYSTINWDLASTLDGVERLFNQFRGENALQTQVFDNANTQLGFDLRKEVLENLEGRITIAQGFTRPIRVNSGSNIYAIRLKNPKAFESNVLPKLMDRIEERNEVKEKQFGKLLVRVFKPGREINSDAPIRQPEICVTMIDDYVVVADSEYMIRQIADVMNGTTNALKDALEYQLIADRISAQLQDKECSAISYARPEESLQLFYELARDPKNIDRLRQVADNNGFFKSLLSALDKHKLPPFSVISKYLAPGGGFLVEEETGLHYMTFSLRRE
ncbi:MAG: hypothetical protein R3C53_04495 [Pirellulaceae bacterium]